jgi:hypothetical protein
VYRTFFLVSRRQTTIQVIFLCVVRITLYPFYDTVAVLLLGSVILLVFLRDDLGRILFLNACIKKRFGLTALYTSSLHE